MVIIIIVVVDLIDCGVKRCTHRPSLLPIERYGEDLGWQESLCAARYIVPSDFVQTLSFRGRRSRNKVSVGEPAEGSLTLLILNKN